MRGITTEDRNQLVNLCMKSKVHFNVQKDHSGVYIRLGSVNYYHYETAKTAIENITRERSFEIKPSIGFLGNFDLPY